MQGIRKTDRKGIRWERMEEMRKKKNLKKKQTHRLVLKNLNFFTTIHINPHKNWQKHRGTYSVLLLFKFWGTPEGWPRHPRAPRTPGWESLL